MSDDVIEHTDMVFIGAVDFNMQDDEFKEEVKSWGNIKEVYYRGPTTGWGTATFTSAEARNSFLAKKRFVLGSKIVDVKPFVRPKYKQPGIVTPAAHTTTTAATASAPPKPQVPSVPGINSIIRPAASAKPSTTGLIGASNAPTALTGVILRYTSQNFGVIRTNNHGNGILSADVVYICSNPDHNLACKTTDCPTYSKLSSHKRVKKSLFAAIPVGTQISFYSRNIDVDGYTFQATMAWPQLSKKPAGATVTALPTTSVLDEQLRRFLSSDDPKTDVKVLQKSTSLDSLDDHDLLDDFDSELDQLNGIQSFLQILGISTTGLYLFPLVEKLSTVSQKTEAVEAIVDFFWKNGIQIDDDKKRNLAANYSTLLSCLRSVPESIGTERNLMSSAFTGDPVRDETTLAERFVQFLINETTPEYFKFVKSKETIVNHCKLVVVMWEARGYSMTRLASEFRESVQDNTTAFLFKKWQTAIEIHISESDLNCLIDPIKIYELTSLFFEREHSMNNLSPVKLGASASQPIVAPVVVPSEVSNGFSKKQIAPAKKAANILEDLKRISVPTDALKSLGNVFRMPTVTDSAPAVAAMESYLDNDTDFKALSVFSEWLKQHYESVPKLIVENELMFTYWITRAWVDSGKSLHDIHLVFMKHISQPKLLFANWAHFIKSSELALALEVIIQFTFKYSHENVQAIKNSVDPNTIVSLYNNVFYMAPEISENSFNSGAVATAYCNLRGIIVHIFNDEYGIIQTPVGRVLFERNIVHGQSRDGSWKRCKTKDLMPPLWTFVKLHAKVVKLKYLRRNGVDVSYLYAYKVWVWSPKGDEPYIGIAILGKDPYWLQSLKEFENLIKNNTQLQYSPTEKGKYEEDYRFIFDHALKQKKENSIQFENLTVSDNDPCLIGYDSFINYLSSKEDFNEKKQNYLVSIKSLTLSPNVSNFHGLRKHFMLHSLLDTLESFHELVEATLLNSHEYQVSKCDIVPALEEFFRNRDPISEAQLQEQHKNLSKNVRGSNAHIEDTFSCIANMLENTYVPPVIVNGPSSIETDPAVIEVGSRSVLPAPLASDSGAKSKVANNTEASTNGTVSVNLHEWNALLKRISELESWKSCKSKEDEEYRARINVAFSDMKGVVSKQEENVRRMQEIALASRSPHPLAATPPPVGRKVNSSKRNVFVRVAIQGSSAIHEIPTDDNDNLPLEYVLSIFEGASALMYVTSSGTTRLCKKSGDVFEQPEDGWEDKLFHPNINSLQGSRNTQNPSVFQGQSQAGFGGMNPFQFGFGGSAGNRPTNMMASSLGFPYFPNNV